MRAMILNMPSTRSKSSLAWDNASVNQTVSPWFLDEGNQKVNILMRRSTILNNLRRTPSRQSFLLASNRSTPRPFNRGYLRFAHYQVVLTLSIKSLMLLSNIDLTEPASTCGTYLSHDVCVHSSPPDTPRLHRFHRLVTTSTSPPQQAGEHACMLIPTPPQMSHSLICKIATNSLVHHPENNMNEALVRRAE